MGLMDEFRPAVVGFAEEVGTSGPVVVVGGRTQWDIGGPADPKARELRAPAGVAEFEPAEMTVTCGAGTLVSDLQEELAASGQRVVLPQLPGATVGGVLAVGRSGIRRLGDGHLRDALLRVVYVDARGDLIRNGGPTVKNVSGFDLCRLMVGSLGTLGLVAEVTLRCLPVPASSRWFSTTVDPLELRSNLYRPTSILWDGRTTWVLLEGNPEDVDHEAVAQGLKPSEGPPPVPSGGRESRRPRELAGLEGQFLAEVGVGTVHRPFPVDPPSADERVTALCAEIKQRFDPDSRLNPGRTAGA